MEVPERELRINSDKRVAEPFPPFDDDSSSHQSQSWKIFGEKLPRSEVVYFCQVTIITIVIIACIVNLSLQNGNSEMWVSFFGYAFGALLPPPKIKNLGGKLMTPSSSLVKHRSDTLKQNFTDSP
jgi:hypothetical protein